MLSLRPSADRSPNRPPFFARYGGKRAFLTHLHYRTLQGLGRLDAYQRVDWARVRRLVFVCAGNICRSPYAEAVARRAGLIVNSFGLDARSGDPANAAAIRNAARKGVDLLSHRACSAHDFTVRTGDLLIGFEPAHCAALADLIGIRDDVAITLLGVWARPAFPYIHDPYGLSDNYFQQCYARIDGPLASIVARARAAVVS